MAYGFDFAPVWDYGAVLGRGLVLTAELTAGAATCGIAIGIAGAAARTSPSKIWRALAATYVEVIRNTPFLVQLFFVFFGIASLGVRFSAWQAAMLAMIVNLGAYATEIIRAGIEATPRGQIEAAESLGLSRFETFRYVVIKPAMRRIWPALSSQVIIVMLGSAVCSQIAAEELTFAANYIESRTFRAFEVYFVATGLYLGLAVLLRWALRGAGRVLFLPRAHG
jgi:polar amino acid transport system permease protein